ncbi:Sugar (and other) transporter [Ceratobasidium sp. AG-Ba]|nr:Sugar (and other) transporter [Ceratobasidium sp. AG-Ba]QRW11443.1 Sugar (and other) transporter [Ceratobasidium sp. AG-Ba]
MTDRKSASSLEPEKADYAHMEHSSGNVTPTHDPKNQLYSGEKNVNAKLANPLAGITHAKLEEQALAFAHSHGLSAEADLIRKGALVAQDPLAFDSLSQLSESDKAELRREQTHRWDQPKTLYYLVALCSMAAAVQGMDETVTNGANLFWPKQFGLFPDDPKNPNAGRDQWLLGLVASAPYLCCAVLGCWLTDPMNRIFGRRGTIFITATLSWLTCFWQGVTNSWPHLFVARFVLGLGVGPKSTTVPVYAAECAPAPIRGAMVMMWQMWTAFGVMLGFVADLVFYHVKDTLHIKGLNWRLMLGSAGVPAIFVMAQVYMCPESPRWLMGKGRYPEAFDSLCRLRKTKLMAARDLYYIHTLLEAEEDVKKNSGFRITELFTVPRNRRAALGSFVVMFMQQFCGVNVIAYYSSTVFSQAGLGDIQAILGSWGFGMLNFVFALPAVYTIDTFGRRFLLLTTFPGMSACLLLTGMAFFIDNIHARTGVVAAGMYLFTVFYSPGEGPVPFTYSAEAFPLYVRDLGMSFATATTCNFVVGITFPRLLGAFRPQGAFGWYAAWNCVGWVLILLFVPETKALSLEELDQGQPDYTIYYITPTH